MGSLKLFFALALVGVLFFSGCLDAVSRKPMPELCSQVSNGLSKSNCLHRVAVRTGNSNYCGRISDVPTKDQCFTDLAEGNTWIGEAGFD